MLVQLDDLRVQTGEIVIYRLVVKNEFLGNLLPLAAPRYTSSGRGEKAAN